MPNLPEDNLPICTACGTQFSLEAGNPPSRCKICDDPRQFVPPSGQSWTTLNQMRKEHRNTWKQDEKDERVWSIWTEPKFAIGQRAFLLTTPHGNVLWDMVALIDRQVVDLITSNGGLSAIVISHPHYYTTYAVWAQTFDCPVYISLDDREWLCRQPPSAGRIEFIEGATGTEKVILPGVTAVKTGGHFPGSLVLHWERGLFVADSIVTVPSAFTPHPRPPGQISYVFMWSIPNMIPLPPDEIMKMWCAIKDLDFTTTYGAFPGMEIRGEDVKGRILQSMQVQVRAEGWEEHVLLRERVA